MTFERLSEYAAAGIPFLFYTDFKAQKLHLYPLNELERYGISYAIDAECDPLPHNIAIEKEPVPFGTYKRKFDYVIEKIRSGDTYLLNLTQPTTIRCGLSLEEIFEKASAKFKLCVRDQFVCFSPERFVRIEHGRIATYPMKGTIDASLPDAEAQILDNTKEMAEHVMVVDLLRNDLGIVADDIRVEKFRYVDRIRAGEKELLQVSSKISGNVGPDWRARLGEILSRLLPAGSISGTPKKSTVEIIETVEGYERGYFTGVFGVYDGETLDSAVMIRFIEKNGDTLIYKSGGGITLDSDAQSEYRELIDKVYIG
jgi:para-aminobenzoate synthetase component 1